MHVHILGICGTFMAGVAVLARALGHRVSGSDQAYYPPMSEVLAQHDIETAPAGYDPEHLSPAPDLVIIGNALSRGNRAVEYVLDRGLPYVSGPAWLAEHFLRERWVLAVSGTHGKTTTASMLAWILESAGLDPGFLIGGVPGNFGLSARPGSAPFFVIEADEYDSAFFDKRSKFIHYHPRTLVMNNLEFDHADIFPDLEAIVTQFHHLVRTVPGNGLIIRPAEERNLDRVLERGVWTEVLTLGSPDGQLEARDRSPSHDAFEIFNDRGQPLGRVDWSQFGAHNVRNGLAALAAARHAGVPLAQGCEALSTFRGVRRRLELRGTANGVHVYDDFAHHPSAIEAVIAAMRDRHPGERLMAVLEARSNTMRMGVHDATLGHALRDADSIHAFAPPDLGWDIGRALAGVAAPVRCASRIGDLLRDIVADARPGDHVLVMSNGSFDNLHPRLLDALQRRADSGNSQDLSR